MNTETKEKAREYVRKWHWNMNEIIESGKIRDAMTFEDTSDLDFDVINFFYDGAIGRIFRDAKKISLQHKNEIRGYVWAKDYLYHYVGWNCLVSKKRHPALHTQEAYDLIMNKLIEDCTEAVKSGEKTMKPLLEIEIDGLPPTVNHLYRSMRGGRRYKTRAGHEYQNKVTAILRQHWKNRPPVNSRVELQIIFQTNDRRRWDIDNRVKALQDCLSKARVLKDDKQVDILHVERKYGDAAKTYLTLKEIEP